MEDSEDEEGLVEAMEENRNFLDIFLQYEDIGQFLNREERVYARASCADEVDQEVFLDFKSDIDGCVVELSRWNGVLIPIKHLTVCHQNRVRPVKSLLRKHVDLTRYTASQMTSFNSSVGFQLFYESGWDAWLALIPDVKCRRGEFKQDMIRDISLKYFKAVRDRFQERLMAQKTLLGRTLMKNDVSNISKLFVLPDDSCLILREFQCAVDEIIVPEAFNVINFCFRFGEKATKGVSLSEFDEKYIQQITTHCAVNISSDVMDLMWSVAGLQAVVGDRGVLNTCLSFSDCACYQSNVDNRLIDVSPDLRKICRHPDKLRFVQLYADIPHRRPETRFHPVSGSIAVGMVYHHKSTAAFEADAAKYISSLESNFDLLNRGECRIEFVVEVEFSETINVSDFLNLNNLYSLIEEKPLLVPFPRRTLLAVKAVGMSICTCLKALFEQYSRTCNVEAVWKAFQLEVAAEKLLWGHPLCFQSHTYSVNLGPGKLTPSRSRTDEYGFLAFDRWSTCMATEDSLPSSRIWGATERLQSKIKRTAGIHDVLDSAPHVLGRRLVHTLIEDFFVASNVGSVIAFNDYKTDLFSETPSRLRVFGAITSKRLVSLLCKERKVPNSMVYGVLCKLLESSRHGLSDILQAGFQEVRVKHFPAIQLYDQHGNAMLSWNWRCGVWKLVHTEALATPTVRSLHLLNSLVLAELELRDLVYVSRLKSASCKSFPWLVPCVRKLASETLDETQMVLVLCFISCVGLLMNGWYVEYSSMEKLLQELPMKHPQARLKDLEIQSKLLLSERSNTFRIFRLHRSVPTKMNMTTPKESSVPPSRTLQNTDETNVDFESNNMISDEEPSTSVNVIVRQPSSLPLVAGEKRKWTGDELEILHDIAERNQGEAGGKKAYEDYQRMCLTRGVQFRTKRAYVCKISKIL